MKFAPYQGVHFHLRLSSSVDEPLKLTVVITANEIKDVIISTSSFVDIELHAILKCRFKIRTHSQCFFSFWCWWLTRKQLPGNKLLAYKFLLLPTGYCCWTPTSWSCACHNFCRKCASSSKYASLRMCAAIAPRWIKPITLPRVSYWLQELWSMSCIVSMVETIL